MFSVRENVENVYISSVTYNYINIPIPYLHVVKRKITILSSKNSAISISKPNDLIIFYCCDLVTRNSAFPTQFRNTIKIIDHRQV